MFSSRENQGYYKFDVCFHTRVGESNDLSCFTDSLQNIHQRALLFTDNRKFVGFLHQQKLSSIYRHELIVIYCALMKHQALLTIQKKLKLAIKLAYYYFYFSVVIQSGEFLASVWQEEGNFEVLNPAVTKYIQL